MFDLEPRKLAEEVDASPSLHSTFILFEETVVLATGAESCEGVDLGRAAVPDCWSTWLSLPAGDVWSVCWEAGKGALTQRTGGSTLPCGGVCVTGLMKGSGLRSEGGTRSGLEDPDLSGFWVNATDSAPPETGAAPPAEL